MSLPKIDYNYIAEAENFYSRRGFSKINVPWYVPREIINITLPPGVVINERNVINDQVLVGSAEQSFLYLTKTQDLKGKFFGTTPCFREDIEDELHHHYFMKTELFQNDDVSEISLAALLGIAQNFFSHYLPIKTIETNDPNSYMSFDIIDEKFGIELGSYGIREHPEVGMWIYGTGCAEPRLSYVLEKRLRDVLNNLKLKPDEPG